MCCSLILVPLVQADDFPLDKMLTVAAPILNNMPLGIQLKVHCKLNCTRCTQELPLLKPNLPSHLHFQMVRTFEEPTVKIKQLAEELPVNVIKRFLGYISPAKLARRSKCDKRYKYRSFDGSCNNLKFTNWGKTNSSLVRLLFPRYATVDGDIVTTSVTGNCLPLPRHISTSIFPFADLPSKEFSLIVMQWGQIIAHDIGRTPSSVSIPVDCCAKVKVPVEQCFPIEIPEDDSFYSTYHQTCINMVRSMIDENSKCIPNQVAAVTHMLDLSAMYGSDSVEAASLRQFKNGFMQISKTDDDREFLPDSLDPESECGMPDEVCFRSGDSRVNQNTQLTCLHVVLLREHNRLAKELKTVNPHWNDEELFQEARAILIAQYQHIIYKEWLPIVLGREYVASHKLLPLTSGNTKYRPDVNPSTINSFVAAAFRVFHSTIEGQIYAVDNGQCPYKSVNISDWMSRPGIILEETNYDDFLRGLTSKPMNNIDRFVTDQITQMLFHGNQEFGEDLISFDIQRGRDHGIPTYNSMRVLCGGHNATCFDDLIDDLGEKVSFLFVSDFN